MQGLHVDTMIRLYMAELPKNLMNAVTVYLHVYVQSILYSFAGINFCVRHYSCITEIIRGPNFCAMRPVLHRINCKGWLLYSLARHWSKMETCVWGYHIYNAIWEAVVWDKLECRRERSNRVNRYAVAVGKVDTIDNTWFRTSTFIRGLIFCRC